MSVGNLKDQGNKGNNFPYQRAVLELLGNISGGSGGCCPATNTFLQNIDTTLTNTTARDSTLQSILAALGQGSTFYSNLIVDNNGTGNTYSEVRIWNGTSFNPSQYYDASGNIVTPILPLVYVNPQYVLNNILLQVVAVSNRTPTMIRTTTSGTIIAGKRSVSFRNAGTINATVLGASLLPGETVNFDAGSLKDTLAAIGYDANGTDLLITTLT
jgi:hypothetical protein